MKYSLTAVLTIIATVGVSAANGADLDSLLGDWTAAASHDSAGGSDLLLGPTSDGVAEINSNSVRSFDPAPAADARDADPKTLASSSAPATHGQGHHSPPPVLPVNGFQLSVPTPNPYYTATRGDCGCRSGPCSSGNCDGGKCDGGKCGGCASGRCGELVPRSQMCAEGESDCRPRRRPLLPPPVTFLNLFRSRSAYSTVWAGYGEETRHRARNKSPHINGTWNTSDDGGLIEPGCNQCQTGCSH